jgi:hypothetical protein
MVRVVAYPILMLTKPNGRFARLGEVTYLHVLGQGLVFLTGEAIFDLLDKRGSIYSDKPHLVMAGELYVPSYAIKSHILTLRA